MRTDKHALAPQGIDCGDLVHHNPRLRRRAEHPSRFGDRRLKTGEVLRSERPGGGGVGAGFERSPEQCWKMYGSDTCRWKGRGKTMESSFVRTVRSLPGRRRDPRVACCL